MGKLCSGQVWPLEGGPLISRLVLSWRPSSHNYMENFLGHDVAACVTQRTAMAQGLHLESTILCHRPILPFMHRYRHIKKLSEGTSCTLSWWCVYVILALDLEAWSRKSTQQPGLCNSKTTTKEAPFHSF